MGLSMRLLRPGLTIVAAVLLGGCGAADSGGAARAAEEFYAAYGADDGAAACAVLSEDTRSRLEQEERSPCREAVLSVQLTGRRAVGTTAYVTEAKVDLDGGETVLLEETAEGWRVSAAGCKPAPGAETPYDCELAS
jgi:hypothetical protein